MFGKGAFDCARCPKTNDVEAPRFCPAWWEEPWYDAKGTEIIRKECSYRMLPDMMRSLGKTAQLSMTTAHEMNRRLDATETMCKDVGEKMAGLAKAFYIAANRAEYLSNEGKSSGTFQRASDANSPGSGLLVDRGTGYTPTDGRGCGGQDAAEGRIGPDADYDSRGAQGTCGPSDAYRNEDSAGERIYSGGECVDDSSDSSTRMVD